MVCNRILLIMPVFLPYNEDGVQYSYPVLVRTPALPEGAVFVEGFVEGTGEGFSMGSYSGAADEGACAYGCVA